ncbi:hypothetical protein [Gottfriedia solisilvae]|uniref:hypothetical protein n=1 Tax=Gottfriedia solisilvae TaxID=1516104 RepID=UPI003D2EAE09
MSYFDVNITQLPLSPKRMSPYKVDGGKFFDNLNKLLREQHDAVQFPASSLAAYILLHLECDPFGRIEFDNKSIHDDKRFNLNIAAKRSSIPYTTLYTGFQTLLQRNLVREILIDGKPYYEIVGYASANTYDFETTSEQSTKLSYFRVPYTLRNNNVLAKLVNARDSKGILLLLDLCNNLSRGYTKTLRLMKTLKHYLNRSAKRVRAYIEMISPIFSFTSEDYSVRKPKESRLTRVRKQVEQILISKFAISFQPGILVENDNTDLNFQVNKVQKDALSRLTLMNVAVRKTDRKSLYVTFNEIIVEKAKYILDTKLKNKLLNVSMSYVMDAIESKLRNGVKVESIGAFTRKCLSDFSKTFFSSLDVKSRLDIIDHYYEINGAIPDFLEK